MDTNVNTATTVSTTPNWVTHYVVWIKSHESILIIILAAILIFHGEDLFTKYEQDKKAKIAEQAQQVVSKDETANKALSDQLVQLKVQVDSQTKALQKNIADNQSNLVKQQKKDAASTPSQIDSRWQELLPLKPGSVTPLDSLASKITNDAANQTVQSLEQIPVLQNEVAGLTKQIEIEQSEIVQQDILISNLNKQIVDEKASHVADVNAEKAKTKHSFWKGFKIGFVTGAIGVEAVRVWVGRP